MNILMNDNDSGPWGNNGGGNNQNPWGKRPQNTPNPPDVDEILRKSKDKFKKVMPSNFGGGKSFSILFLVLLILWLF